jgi:hypothetical protein
VHAAGSGIHLCLSAVHHAYVFKAANGPRSAPLGLDGARRRRASRRVAAEVNGHVSAWDCMAMAQRQCPATGHELHEKGEPSTVRTTRHSLTVRALVTRPLIRFASPSHRTATAIAAGTTSHSLRSGAAARARISTCRHVSGHRTRTAAAAATIRIRIDDGDRRSAQQQRQREQQSHWCRRESAAERTPSAQTRWSTSVPVVWCYCRCIADVSTGAVVRQSVRQRRRCVHTAGQHLTSAIST